MAAKFRFRLDFLIKLRARREEEARLRLAQRLASIRDLLEEIEATQALRARLTAELAEKMKTGHLDVALLKLYRDYDQKQVRDLGRLHEFLRLSRKEEARERAALIKASVDRKIMEKLKERKQAEFAAAQAALEQNEMEELAALVRARRAKA
jgi:flagellar FliJ protein